MFVLCAGSTIVGDLQVDIVSANVLGLDGNASINQFFLQTSASIYLFTEPVPDRGTISEIRCFGYYSDESFEQERLHIMLEPAVKFDAHLFVVVFRRREEKGLYQLIHGPQELRHVFTPGTLTVEWAVQSGDLVGALIPGSCTNRSNLSVGCPAHIDMRTDPSSCSSALYYPIAADLGVHSEELISIPGDQFEEVQVHLNMEFLIDDSAGGSIQV
jgi:hypothetical protein